MANTPKSGSQKSRSSQNNRSAGRTNNQKRQTKKPTNNQAKSQPKKQAQKNTANGQMYIEREKAQNATRQTSAIILFAVAILMLCLTLVPGGNVWAALQGFLFGLFGVCAFVWPLVLIYIAIMLSLDKPMANLKFTMTSATILVLLICAAVDIFSSSADITAWSDYWGEIESAYTLGLDSTNGGVFGAIIGGALLWLFASKTPAAVTICILIFAALLLVTGTTLAGFFMTVWKPVEKGGKAAGEQIENTRRIIEERREQRRFNPDVDLGPEYSEDLENIDYESDEKTERTSKKSAKASPINEGTEKEAIVKETAPEVDFSTTEPAPPSVLLEDIIKKAAGSGAAAQAAVAKKSEKAEDKSAVEEKLASDEKPTLAASDESGTKKYRLPPVSCLNPPKLDLAGTSEDELRANAQRLVDVLKSFGVETTIVDICRGPSVTRYELSPAAGVRISKITGLADDIALSLAATGVRIEAPIPGKAAVGIEVPNRDRSSVSLREIIESGEYKKNVAKSKLSVALGKDITGGICTMDIAKMPHLLVAGTTGSGKSVCLNAMILSILFNATPDEVKLVMIDPKQVEFTNYNGLPHMLIPVVTDPRKAAGALAWAVKEMLKRYKSFSENSVRDIFGYNELAKSDPEKQPMPQIVIFIDEFSDLMMAASAEVEDSICRLAQMARAAGMHLVIATQSPRADVITGLIKANVPSRLSLKVSNGMESRIILDMQGAEKLLGNGDMLFNPVGSSKPTRIQGCYVPDKEIEEVIDFIKSQEQSSYNEGVLEEIDRHAAAVENADKKSGGVDSAGGDSTDALFKEAIELVVNNGQASTTFIQRKLSVGYARAARIIDELEEHGIVGPFEGSKPRKVLISKNQWLEMNAMAADSEPAGESVQSEDDFLD